MLTPQLALNVTDGAIQLVALVWLNPLECCQGGRSRVLAKQRSRVRARYEPNCLEVVLTKKAT